MAELHFYDSMEELWAAENRNRKAADSRVTLPQARMKVGDCYIRYESSVRLVVYGEVLDPCVPAAPYDKNVSPAELEEYKAEGEIFDQPHMKYFRFCRCFSVIEPRGELGNIHCSTMDVPVPRRVFEIARRLDWPNDPTGMEIVEAVRAERGDDHRA
jgi:hypothetical protein